MNSENVEAGFHDALLKTYEEMKEFDSLAPIFLEMLKNEGAVALTKRLVKEKGAQSGLLRAWELGLLDHSVEAKMLDEKFKSLFTEQELSKARARLDALKLSETAAAPHPRFKEKDAPQTLPELEAKFSASMLIALEESKEWDSFADSLMKKVSEKGGLSVAKGILKSREQSLGLLNLWRAKRLDLSVESLILQNDFRPLFSNDEVLIAKSKLELLDYDAESK
jgi:hypothetical protein